MKLVGHKIESIYRRYAIVSKADLKEGVSKLAAVTGTKKETTCSIRPRGAYSLIRYKPR